jgi:hypothetical protein
VAACRLRSSLALLVGLLVGPAGCGESAPSQNSLGLGGQASGGTAGEVTSGSAGVPAASGGSDVGAGGAPATTAGASSGGAGGAAGGAVVTAGAPNGGSAGAAPTLDVDPSALTGKHLFGYQGWFSCPGDGGANRWVHWFRSNTPSAANATFDLWPDVSELDDDELFATNLSMPGGGTGRLYSAYKAKTVARHFAWMKAAGIDGVFVQRFLVDVKNASTRKIRDQVLNNVRAGAEAHGRVFAIMYDISGATESTLVADLEAEWQHLVVDLKITDSPRYQRHAGKPVLAIWGLGFSDRPGTAVQAKKLLDDLHSGAAPVAIMGGVPSGWRTLDDDSKTDAAWAPVYRAFDVVSPWSVGRYTNDAGADKFKTDHIVPDLAALKPLNVSYMPVVFPGFSWHNLNGDPLNQIPRRGGAFYWRQVYNAVQAGSTMLYGAMFDEVDEGTAFFKIAPSHAALPAQGTFVAWDADGATLPSDWYLRLGGAATQTLRGELAPSPQLPLKPP